MINIDLRADDFDLELKKVRIMNEIKKAQRKSYYGCKDLEMCKNYHPDKCTMCVRTTGNADCNDFYDDSDLYFDSDQDDIDDMYLSDFHLDPFGIDPIV